MSLKHLADRPMIFQNLVFGIAGITSYAWNNSFTLGSLPYEPPARLANHGLCDRKRRRVHRIAGKTVSTADSLYAVRIDHTQILRRLPWTRHTYFS
jgi:hypothetical protein